MEERNEALVRAYLAAVARFDKDAVGALIDPAIVQTEYPNKLLAAGQVRGREDMLRDLPKGASVLRSQVYLIETIIAAGDKVVVETRWEGVLNVPVGRLQRGDAMVAHICMIFTINDGRIVGQKNYDCYEDFSPIERKRTKTGQRRARSRAWASMNPPGDRARGSGGLADGGDDGGKADPGTGERPVTAREGGRAGH